MSSKVIDLAGRRVNLAQTLASQVATAIVNAQLYVAEQQRASELERLQSISQRLEADLSLDEMLKAILDGVQSLVPCAGAEICLYEASGMYVAQTRGIRPDGEPPLQRINEGLTGWLARQRRALRLPDFQHPPTRPLFSMLADGALARSYLGLPLQVGDQLIGTLELFSTRADDFSPADERLLTIVAGQAAQAISNTRRYEQADEHLRSRVQQLTALQRISRQLTSESVARPYPWLHARRGAAGNPSHQRLYRTARGLRIRRGDAGVLAG